ncbi:hypothetical protein FSCOSCO3_A024182 [Scomber scombrus]|uniref:Cytochrome P450 26A1 n=1 Tax=Scomber scombrus TaxID=13677 RepID=A0AAV1P4J1_SCOSC
MAENETLECITEHERILQEIESTDTACVGPTLRSIYDDQPNAHKRFMEKLDARIRNHDREIEKMCNFHHQGFVDAITELLKVRTDAEKLMGQVTDTNRRLQEAGREVTAQTEEVIRCRIQQRNMATTVEKLQLCIPVLEMYSKLKEQLESKRYYAALKTMEQLEKVYIPRVSHYRFCQIMAENLPRLREEIKEISMSDLKDFLESIRKHSDKVGETAMRQAHQHRTFNSVVAKQASLGHYTKPVYSLNGRTHTHTHNGLLMDDDTGDEEEGDEEVLTAQDLVDFSPVYRCLHIYTVLGDRETFENYYRKQRKKQARLVLQPQSNMHETVEGYRRYFNQIVGFFVVEDHILHAARGLVTRAFTDELWNMALSKIIAVLRTHSSYCDDPDLVLELKNLIVIFADTLQGYGFPVNRLFDLLFEVRDQYNETLLKKWALVFREIFELDNYSPIPVETEEEYKLVISRFPFHDAEIEKQDFPKKLPMSQSVPQIYTQVKEFIYASLKFSESLHRSSTEIDDMLRKSTNLLLTRTLSSCLQNLIKKPHIGLTELVQIIINTTHLEQACRYLEEFITNITNVSPETVHTTRLYGLSTFKDARHAAEGEIYTKLNQKIDEFIQLADYEWGMAESDGRASGYLMDLINFLRSTFQVFTHLPGKVAQTACMSACKHLSTSLMQMLLDTELKQISMGAIQQFNLDVIQCELFASSEPVPGFQGDTLQLAFIDLRQLLDLFMVWDWSTYLADYGQPTSKYLRVNPATALALLEKMKDTSKKNNIFSQFRKNDRDKQKLIETVVKQLRSLPIKALHEQAGASVADRVSPELSHRSDKTLNMAVNTLLATFLCTIVLPVLLFLVAVKLWEVYTIRGRDPSCSRPLPPGSMGLPFIGETLQLILQRRKFLQMKRQKYGFVHRTHLFGHPTVRVTGADNVRQILLGEHKLVSVQWPASVRTILGADTLSNVHGALHKTKKKAIMRAFSKEALELYIPVIQEEVRAAVKDWLEKDSCVLVYPEMKRLMFRISMRILLGFEPDQIKTDEHQLVEAFEEMIKNLFSLPIDVPFSGLYRGLKARNFIHSKIEENIKKKVQESDKESKHRDALQQLIDSSKNNGEPFSMQAIKESATELLFGGHETTASTSTSLIMFLGLNPEVVDRLRQELMEKEEQGMDIQNLNIESLEQLKYTSCVIKETLRINPPVPGGFRVALKTFELNGYQIPKGWNVIYSICDTHDVADMFPNKEDFQPERFMTKPKTDSSRFQYIPFGGGSRMCVGKEFAKVLLKIFLVEVVTKCHWTLLNGPPTMKTGPTLYPVDNLPTKFTSYVQN